MIRPHPLPFGPVCSDLGAPLSHSRPHRVTTGRYRYRTPVLRTAGTDYSVESTSLGSATLALAPHHARTHAHTHTHAPPLGCRIAPPKIIFPAPGLFSRETSSSYLFTSSLLFTTHTSLCFPFVSSNFCFLTAHTVAALPSSPVRYRDSTAPRTCPPQPVSRITTTTHDDRHRSPNGGSAFQLYLFLFRAIRAIPSLGQWPPPKYDSTWPLPSALPLDLTCSTFAEEIPLLTCSPFPPCRRCSSPGH